jgi:hypothetical protein
MDSWSGSVDDESPFQEFPEPELDETLEYVEIEGETPRQRFKRKLEEAIRKLDPATGGGITFRAPTVSNKFTDEWTKVNDRWLAEKTGEPYKMLVLKEGKSPAAAIRRIVENADQWSADCAYFVQIVHLYALSQTDPTAFDNRLRGKRFYLRYHSSTGIRAKYFFDREKKAHAWRAWFPLRAGARSTLNPINTARWTTSRIKAAMPIGSRLMWRNNLIKRGESAFRNENAVKVGNDRYRAFGFGIRRRMSESEIRTKLAEVTSNTFPGPNDPNLSTSEYRNRHIFLSEAQSFKTPD